jgi:hypothetical protein
MRRRAAGVSVVVGVSFILLMPPFVHAFETSAERTLQAGLCLATMGTYLLAALALSRGWSRWAWVIGAAGILGLGTTLAFERGNQHPWELERLGANGPMHWFLSGVTVLVATVPPLRTWVGLAPRGTVISKKQGNDPASNGQ